MSMAMAHFAVGATLTTLLVAFLVPDFQYPRTVTVAGGGWAMLPDFHWVSPVFEQQLRVLHQTSPLVDIFWFHGILDHADPTNSKTIAAVFLAVWMLATVLAEHRSVRKVVKSAYGSVLGEDSS